MDDDTPLMRADEPRKPIKEEFYVETPFLHPEDIKGPRGSEEFGKGPKREDHVVEVQYDGFLQLPDAVATRLDAVGQLLLTRDGYNVGSGIMGDVEISDWDEEANTSRYEVRDGTLLSGEFRRGDMYNVSFTGDEIQISKPLTNYPLKVEDGAVRLPTRALDILRDTAGGDISQVLMIDFKGLRQCFADVAPDEEGDEFQRKLDFILREGANHIRGEYYLKVEDGMMELPSNMYSDGEEVNFSPQRDSFVLN